MGRRLRPQRNWLDPDPARSSATGARHSGPMTVQERAARKCVEPAPGIALWAPGRRISGHPPVRSKGSREGVERCVDRCRVRLRVRRSPLRITQPEPGQASRPPCSGLYMQTGRLFEAPCGGSRPAQAMALVISSREGFLTWRSQCSRNHWAAHGTATRFSLWRKSTR